MVHRSTRHAWQILWMKNHPHTQFTDSLHLTLGLTLPVCPAPVDLIFRSLCFISEIGICHCPRQSSAMELGVKVTCVILMLANN